MSDILLSWLASEAGLHVEQVEKDFANGYLWGQLFSKFNLQPDFEGRFENKRTPDAMVNNFTRLQPTFKRLGVTMNTRIANSLMREEPGVAMRLLYSVKQNLGQLNKDLEKFKSTGRLGRDLGASVPVSRTLLEAAQFRTPKQTYEQGAMRFFEETIRQKVPASGKQMMESMHLRRFSERQYKQEAAAAMAADTDRQTMASKRSMFHDTAHSQLAKSRVDKGKQLERDAAVHASLMRRKEETEREELRVELALAEASRRRKVAGVTQAAADVTHGIDTFEINMKRLLKGDSHGEEQLAPATTHSPLEHQAKLRAMATSSTKLLEEMAGYMAGVRAQRADDLATKREREARRRRMLVEQQAAACEAARKVEAEALLQALARSSGEEQRLAARLWQLSQEKEVMRENRAQREQQYAEQRAQDWEQTLRRELQLHASLRQQYEEQAAVEKAAWLAAQAERARAKAAKHRTMCEGMAWQVVQLAERVIEYRQRTGQLVPRNEWRRWAAMFVCNDPQLGDPVVKHTNDGPTRNLALERAAVADWLSCRGEFEREGSAGAITPNAPLGVLVAELSGQAKVPDAPSLPVCIHQLPLKLSVVGPPFSGKTSVAHALAQQHRLRVLEPEALVQAAVDAAKTWLASQQQQPAQPADGDAAADAGDAAGAAAAAAPPPNKQVELGLLLNAALQAGQPLPDDAIVPLIVLAMEETVGWVPPPPPADDAKKAKPGVKPAKGAAPEEPPKPVQGFVLDGFPRTLEQAVLLEKALTGLDLAGEQAVIDAASQVAPPPPHMLPQLGRVLTSGMDAVLVLSLADPELALKRALGRRLDPQTGRVYHLEFDAPPPTDVGLAARLTEVADPSNDAAHVQQRLLAHAAHAAPLDAWHRRFTRLRRPIDGSGVLKDVVAAADDATQGILRAKAAVDSCKAAAEAAQKAHSAADKAREYAELARLHAESAALDLLVAKKAEVQAQALLDGTAEAAAGGAPGGAAKKDGKGGKKDAVSPPDPAAVELLRAQSAAKCAEQLKVCRSAASDAAGYAERAHEAASTASQAVQRARLSLGDAEISATAEVEAKEAAVTAEAAQVAAADAAQRAEAAKQAAEVAVKEATRVAEAASVEADAQLELTPPATEAAVETAAGAAAAAAGEGEQVGQQPAGAAPMPLQLAQAFMQEFTQLEGSYLEGVALGLSHLVEHGGLVLAHYDAVRGQFKQLLATPDNRAALVAKFQKDFNAVDADARKQKETQAELALRSEELREAIWGLCDKKMEAAEAERAAVAADSFVSEHTTMLSQYYTALAQVELDRLYSTVTFIKGYVAARHGVLHPLEPADGAAPADGVAVTPPDLLSGAVPPELKDKLDEKSKASMPVPPQVAQLAAKSPALATALKVALAAAAAAVATAMPPPPDDGTKKKPAKKEAAKGGKPSTPEISADDAVPAAVVEAISSEVSALATEEGRILQDRLLLLAQHAATSMSGLASLNTTTLDTLSAWTKARYQAECSAALALDRIAKAAALAGEQLPCELRLEDDGTVLVVDQGLQVVPPHPGYPPPPPRERPPPATVFAVSQLAHLVGLLAGMAPGGFVKVAELAEVVLKAGGQGELPEAWLGVSGPALQASLRLLDGTCTGYVDWREVVAQLVSAAFPLIPQATCADMADQCEMLCEADKDKDGLVSEDEWLGVELWFQYRAFQPGSVADLEADRLAEEARTAARKEAFDRAGALKKVLWAAFSSPAPEGSPAAGTLRLDFRALLLYLCADRDHFSGIKKAFSVAAGSIASNARVDAAQLSKVAYPLGTEAGQHIHRCPMDREALSQVVATIYQSRGGAPEGVPSISAEQLMYGAHGERVLNHLLGRYQLQDLFTATKLALY